MLAFGDDRVSFNGVNLRTGRYLFEPELTKDVLRLVRKAPTSREDLVRHWQWIDQQPERPLAVRYGFEATRVESSGWALVLAQETPAAVRQALAPLLELRRGQAGPLYREFMVGRGEDKRAFLERLKARPDGPVDPRVVPYYLLLVGDPEQISFELQYGLDVQYAVGRLWFQTPDEYAAYARAVLRAEGEAQSERRAVVFAVRKREDEATDLSATRLARPLHRELVRHGADWSVQIVDEDRATKQALAAHLSGTDVPALLFTASHGLGTPPGDPDQRALQGAVLCQEWDLVRGEDHPVPPEMFFAGDDIRPGADLQGLISVLFGCYSAGTPKTDDYWFRSGDRPRDLAPHPFIAQLPLRLLSHGSLAVLGHVDRGWSCSFAWSGRRITDPAVYVDLLRALVDGNPVGLATEPLGMRCAELAADVQRALTKLESFPEEQHLMTKISELWTSYNDARGMIVLGDPAVRVRLKAISHTVDATAERVQVQAARDSDGPLAPTDTVPEGSTPQARDARAQEHRRPAAEQAPGLSLDELEHALVTALRQALAAGVGLEIAVYRGGDPTALQQALAAGQTPAPEHLALLTRLDSEGRVAIVLPGTEAELPASVWRAHVEAVELARTYQLEMLRTAAEILSRLRGEAT